eukprot:10589720-Heterocapsa_arctica.AAC.1
MAVRKRRVNQWAMQLNDGRFSSPETLVWEIAARGELARLKGRHFVAAYIDCSKKPRVIQVHKANTEGIHANMGIRAGCGYAVHCLKAMIKVEVKKEEKELMYFVDDMVLFREDPTETQA